MRLMLRRNACMHAFQIKTCKNVDWSITCKPTAWLVDWNFSHGVRLHLVPSYFSLGPIIHMREILLTDHLVCFKLSSKCLYKCALCWCCVCGSVTCLWTLCSFEETFKHYRAPGVAVSTNGGAKKVCKPPKKTKTFLYRILFAKQTQIVYEGADVRSYCLSTPIHCIYVRDWISHAYRFQRSAQLPVLYGYKFHPLITSAATPCRISNS